MSFIEDKHIYVCNLYLTKLGSLQSFCKPGTNASKYCAEQHYKKEKQKCIFCLGKLRQSRLTSQKIEKQHLLLCLGWEFTLHFPFRGLLT